MMVQGARHTEGCGSAIYIERPGASTRVRTWTPTEGKFHGWLITHNESISLSDYLTIPPGSGSEATYRPTVHYAYHPCDDAVLSLHELAGKGWVEQTEKKLIVDGELLSRNTSPPSPACALERSQQPALTTTAGVYAYAITEITSGIDELGVLLMGTTAAGDNFAYW